jgi:hypothetical protein
MGAIAQDLWEAFRGKKTRVKTQTYGQYWKMTNTMGKSESFTRLELYIYAFTFPSFAFS